MADAIVGGGGASEGADGIGHGSDEGEEGSGGKPSDGEEVMVPCDSDAGAAVPKSAERGGAFMRRA